MVSCHVYRICMSKEVWGRFKVIIQGDNASHKRGEAVFMGEGGFSVCNTDVLKLYC